MKISVVTVSFNARKTIGFTIESFLGQHHADKELLVFDGGSTDGTPEFVASFGSPLIRLVSEPDRGMYDALNKGLRAFSGDAVGGLNADDRFHDPGVLGDVAEALEEAEIVFGDLDFVESHDGGKIVRRWRGSGYPRSGFRSGWMPAHPTFYVRRAVAEAVGPFDLAYPTAADYDWMLRALELQDFTSRHLPRVMVDMMVGGKSTSGIRSSIAHNLEALRSRRRRLGTGPIDRALFAKPLRKLGQFAGH